jgi:hypothetical protein
MKNIPWTKIGITLLWVLGIATIGISLAFTEIKQQDLKCKKITINVNKSDENYFINKQDISIKRSVAFFIETYADQIEKCIQDFAERVINEMSITSSDWSLRRNFGLFFRTFVPSIRQTLSEEFKEFISETDFDLSFRKAS